MKSEDDERALDASAGSSGSPVDQGGARAPSETSDNLVPAPEASANPLAESPCSIESACAGDDPQCADQLARRDDFQALLSERERSWDQHPIITESAVLPTRPVKDALARLKLISRKARASMAFWADPVSGKTSCIRAMIRAIEQDFVDAGILLLEAVEDARQAEGRLLLSILSAIGYAHKVDRELAGKREQVRRALIALSGSAKHLFIIIDEAQELTNEEYAWLKSVINNLARAGIKVTTVLFGQRELLKREENLKSQGRSDLHTRFFGQLREFKRVRTEDDMTALGEALDNNSEWPMGSGWTFTQFLFPRAHRSGFRFKAQSPNMWSAVEKVMGRSNIAKGIPMAVIAAYLANICILCKNLDAPDLQISSKLLEKAFKAALQGR